MKRALAALAIVVFAAAVPVMAQAQDDDDAQARTFFDEGVAALDQGRFADAADLLARSLELRDSPPARFNRAVALRGAGRYLEAIAETERYLEQATEPRHARTRAHAETILEELRASVAVLVLDVVGDPDEVRIDDERVAGADAHLELRRDPGDVHVRVTRSGYAPIDRTVSLDAGARESLHVDASESPLPATLTVDATPPIATIAIDGELAGSGHAVLTRPPGTYRLAFDAEGFVAERREVTLDPGAESALSVNLTAIPPTPIESEWWFWTLVGAGVVAVGVAIAVAVVLANDTPPIELGSLGFSQEVLRWSM
ncbi:MAG: PEGA domain-containing protein [Sandaracinaceae bacterium]|nr:PEGA domain-containing protein [Sandaracinaceae bacterium]